MDNLTVDRDSGKVVGEFVCNTCRGSGIERRFFRETCSDCEGDGRYHAPCKAKGCDRGVYTKPNGTMVICRVCKGTGVYKSPTRRCRRCKGAGTIKKYYEDVCRSCGGKGYVKRTMKFFNPVLNIKSDTANKLMKMTSGEGGE